MNTLCFRTLFVIMSIRRSLSVLNEFSNCHDDFTLKPPDGVLKKNTFSWLAFVEYKHVITGLPHPSKAPRVTLIQRQYVIGTALDLYKLPKNYKLGNVIFGEYDREEKDCDLTQDMVRNGGKCPYAYLETAVLDVTPHPEYSRFGIGNSLALVKLHKPLKSRYMVPICLPSIGERFKKRKNKFVFMVDYMSSVPQDLRVERMGKKTLKLYTHKDCRRHRMKMGLGNEGVSHLLCSTGCGIRPGAPILSHSVEGLFELIGIAAGGALCSNRSNRRRLSNEPPLYIDVYPYMSWLMNVVTAYELPMPHPLGFRRMGSGTSIGIHKNFLRGKKEQKTGWRGRTFVAGNLCFKEKKKRDNASFFYSETFEINTQVSSRMTLSMKISAGIDCTIVCARLLLPSRLTKPEIIGVGGYNISINFTTDWFPLKYSYSLGLLGKNTSQANLAKWLPEFQLG